jgi:hypothetical protein
MLAPGSLEKRYIGVNMFAISSLVGLLPPTCQYFKIYALGPALTLRKNRSHGGGNPVGSTLNSNISANSHSFRVWISGWGTCFARRNRGQLISWQFPFKHVPVHATTVTFSCHGHICMLNFFISNLQLLSSKSYNQLKTSSENFTTLNATLRWKLHYAESYTVLKAAPVENWVDGKLHQHLIPRLIALCAVPFYNSLILHLHNI